MASPFHLDPEFTERSAIACDSMRATVITTRRVIEESRDLLARIAVLSVRDPFLDHRHRRAQAGTCPAPVNNCSLSVQLARMLIDHRLWHSLGVGG
jgi:hypothetical protein